MRALIAKPFVLGALVSFFLATCVELMELALIKYKRFRRKK